MIDTTTFLSTWYQNYSAIAPENVDKRRRFLKDAVKFCEGELSSKKILRSWESSKEFYERIAKICLSILVILTCFIFTILIPTGVLHRFSLAMNISLPIAFGSLGFLSVYCATYFIKVHLDPTYAYPASACKKALIKIYILLKQLPSSTSTFY